MSTHLSLEKIHTLTLNIGTKCNVRCSMCYIDNYELTLPSIVYEKRLVPLYPYLKQVNILGGELTVIPETKNVIRCIHDINPKVRFDFVTNGVKFDEKWQQFASHVAAKVTYSLNACTEETYNKISNSGQFPKILANVSRHVDHNDREKVKICLSFVILPKNIHELLDFVKLANSMNVSGIMIAFNQQLIPSKSIQLLKAQLLKTFEYIHNNDFKPEVWGLNESIRFFYPNMVIGEEKDPSPCKRCMHELHVDPQGFVQTCCFHQIILGNIVNQTLEELLSNSFAKIVAKTSQNELNSYCRPDCLSNDRKEPMKIISSILANIIKAYHFSQVSPSHLFARIKRYIKRIISSP